MKFFNVFKGYKDAEGRLLHMAPPGGEAEPTTTETPKPATEAPRGDPDRPEPRTAEEIKRAKEDADKRNEEAIANIHKEYEDLSSDMSPEDALEKIKTDYKEKFDIQVSSDGKLLVTIKVTVETPAPEDKRTPEEKREQQNFLKLLEEDVADLEAFTADAPPMSPEFAAKDLSVVLNEAVAAEKNPTIKKQLAYILMVIKKCREKMPSIGTDTPEAVQYQKLYKRFEEAAKKFLFKREQERNADPKAISPAEQDKLVKAAKAELKPEELAKMTPEEREVAIAKLMKKHGVSISAKADDSGEYEVNAPKAQWERIFNQVLGSIGVFMGSVNKFFAAFKPRGAPTATPEKISASKAAKESKQRIEDALKTGKSLEDIKEAKLDLKGRAQTALDDAKNTKESAEKNAKAAKTNLDALKTQRSVAVDDATKAELDTKIVTAETIQKKADESLVDANKLIEKAQKLVAEIDEDLKTIEEMEKKATSPDKKDEKPADEKPATEKLIDNPEIREAFIKTVQEHWETFRDKWGPTLAAEKVDQIKKELCTALKLPSDVTIKIMVINKDPDGLKFLVRNKEDESKVYAELIVAKPADTPSDPSKPDATPDSPELVEAKKEWDSTFGLEVSYRLIKETSAADLTVKNATETLLGNLPLMMKVKGSEIPDLIIKLDKQLKENTNLEEATKNRVSALKQSLQMMTS